MKIKIGNFNFISESENEYSKYHEIEKDMEYFYLDGKEDTLFVTYIIKFEREKNGQEVPEFEKELMNKFNIVDIYNEAKKQIREFINNKVNTIYDNKLYSKYELYKELDFSDISNLEEESKFNFNYEDYLKLDFENNKINFGEFQYNPYTQKIENLEEMIDKKVFNKKIKVGLILKEIQNKIAPPYIYEVRKINEFLKDKENVNLIFKDMEKFKSRSSMSYFLEYRNGKININLGHKEGKNFSNANPNKDIDMINLKNFKGLSYGRNILEIDNMALLNINMQIAMTLEDKLKQRIDFLKEDIKENYYEYRNKIETEIYNVPYTLEDAIYRIKNNAGAKEDIEWYNKELKEIIHKNNLINFLSEAKTIEDIKDVCVELGDNELQNIYYGLLYEEENCEENEEEQEC